MRWAVNHSPRETTYSGECFLMFLANSSNFSCTGHLRPSSEAMSRKRRSMSARSAVQSTWYWMCAFTSSRRSVILLSEESRLPAADTTTKRRSGSASTMDLTLRNCSADATDDPPNLAILIMRGTWPFYTAGSAAMNVVGSARSASSSRARAPSAVRSRTRRAPGANSSACPSSAAVRST